MDASHVPAPRDDESVSSTSCRGGSLLRLRTHRQTGDDGMSSPLQLMLLLCMTARVNFWAMSSSRWSFRAAEHAEGLRAVSRVLEARGGSRERLFPGCGPNARPHQRLGQSLMTNPSYDLLVAMNSLMRHPGGLVLRLRRQTDETRPPARMLSPAAPPRPPRSEPHRSCCRSPCPGCSGTRRRSLAAGDTDAQDLVDAVDDQVSPVLENLHHPAHRLL